MSDPFSHLVGGVRKKSRLSKAQAIEIAEKVFASLGGKGKYLLYASYDGVFWCVDVLSGEEDIPEIKIVDETGEVVPQHILRKEREAAMKAHLEKINAANLTIEQVVEIVSEHLVRSGYAEFEVDVSGIGDGIWIAFVLAVVSGEDIRFMRYVDDLNGGILYYPNRDAEQGPLL